MSDTREANGSATGHANGDANDVRPVGEHGPLRTIIALFDDTIDAEHALSALRKSDQPAEEISVILRDRVSEHGSRTSQVTLLSRVIASSALETVSGWLQGLASLILPEDRASYLVAGPIGVMLASIREARTDGSDDLGYRATNRQLTRALALFGFETDEATYVEQRVVLGSPLIAVTSQQAPVLRTAHAIFSTNTAVYIGLTHTDVSIQSAAARLLVTGPRAGGPVVITDAVAPLRSLQSSDWHAHYDRTIRGRQVVSRLGRPIGRVADVLYEVQVWEDPSTHAEVSRTIPRYVIVQTQGLVPGRRRTAVPAELVDVDQNPVLLRVTQPELRRAPRYDASRPLSRQDEVALRRYFHVRNYWIRHGSSPIEGPSSSRHDD